MDFKNLLCNADGCNDILTALSQPGNAEKLARARESCWHRHGQSHEGGFPLGHLNST